MGFQHVQFIGGEPMFYPHIHELVQEACGLGFQEVELFSNLTTVAPWLLATPKPRIVIATSFYSDDPAVHDAVTETPGSFQRTVASIRTLIAAGYTLRAGFIEMETNAGYFDRTVAFLKTLGVKDVDHDKARQFGRADPGEAAPDMAQLCGQCSGSNLSIDVEGRVSGCIMSKPWAFGNIQDDSLEILYDSPDRQKFVRDLEEIVRDRGPVEIHGCEPCAPAGCAPCAPPPWCGPQR
jgi:radical SAM protein with 4Fe4S-binding SPASM domain